MNADPGSVPIARSSSIASSPSPMIALCGALALGCALGAASAHAQDAAGGGAPSQPAASTPTATAEAQNIPLTGDYFQFEVDVTGFTLTDGTSTTTYMAPAGSCLRVSNEKPAADGKSTKVSVTFLQAFPLPIRVVDTLFSVFKGSTPSCVPPAKQTSGDPPLVLANKSYDVDKPLVATDRDRLRYGYTYGVLVAPFKFYLTDHNFSAGAMVGPYLGYRIHDRPGNSSVLAFAFGPTTATVKTLQADGSSSTSNANGVSAALAYLGNVKNQFDIGVILGADYFPRSANIDGSGKKWLGITFGAKLD